MKKIFKYGIVGLIGTALDAGLLFFFVEYARLGLIPAATISYTAAVINNFFLNKLWTFSDRGREVRRPYGKFVAISVMGLVLNNFCLLFIMRFFSLWIIWAKLITSAVIMLWNFFMNKIWTFRRIPVGAPLDLAPKCDVSIVIPAYNEEINITPIVERVEAHLSTIGMSHEIIVVDDGSRDATVPIVRSLEKSIPSLRCIALGENRGKGYAVREGVHTAQGAVIAFLDADGSTDIAELDACIPLLQSGTDIVIGSRYLPESRITINQPLLRVLLGRFGNMVIHLTLFDGIVDTQCGFKAFRGPVAKILFARQRITRWAFDMEVLAIAVHMGFSIREVPVTWKNATNRSSRLRAFRDALRTFRDLVRIKYNIMTSRYDAIPVEK